MRLQVPDRLSRVDGEDAPAAALCHRRMGSDEGATTLRSRAAVSHERSDQRRNRRGTQTSTAETAAVRLPTSLQ